MSGHDGEDAYGHGDVNDHDHPSSLCGPTDVDLEHCHSRKIHHRVQPLGEGPDPFTH
jgi:hypothetical protein